MEGGERRRKALLERGNLGFLYLRMRLAMLGFGCLGLVLRSRNLLSGE